jgi:DNA repair protein RadD
LEALRQSLKSSKRRPMLMAPTGAGKTLLAVHIIQRALDKGNRVIFTVPAKSLIDQTVKALEGEGVRCIGVMQANHPRTDPMQPVQVCSVQTLVRRQRPGAAIVVIDEAHLAFKSVYDWMADPAWASVPFVGLSATPWTKGLGKHFDDLIIAATTAELIEAGYLSKFVAFAPSVPDLSIVRTIAGDYHEGQLAEVCDRPEIVGDVIETWQARGEDRPTLVYGVNRAHAEHLQQRFVEAGVVAEYMDCDTEREARERIFDRFRSGETKIICNVATLTVGLDLDVRCIVDARPTRSEMRFVQTIGRGLRTAPGKDRLIVLDHAGNHLRLGMVTDIHHDKLDDGEKRLGKDERAERSEPLPRLCDECKAVVPRQLKVCPQCGHVIEAKSNVVHIDGELVEYGSGEQTSWNATIADKAAFFGEAEGYRLDLVRKGKTLKPGWTAHQFKERFGHWPPFDWRGRIPPEPPSLKTRGWIKSRQIAYAKARARG